MFIWFVVGSVVAVTLVFDSPSMDVRLVALGAVLPVAEALVGGPWLLHTPILGVVGLAVVMLVARGHRLVQRRWLGVPIGLLLLLCGGLALRRRWRSRGAAAGVSGPEATG